MSKKIRPTSIALLLVLILSTSTSSLLAREKPSLLVVPARKRVVKLAFDMARMRSVFLVSYQQGDDDATPFMHIWDSSRRQWLQTDIERYREAVHFSVTPETVFLLGTPKEFPAALQDASGWAKNIVRMENLSPAELVNELNDHMHFSSREWRELARNHSLKLDDRNTLRRRYGRYGPPGSKNTSPRIEIEEEQSSAPITLQPMEKPLAIEKPNIETPALILEPIEEPAPAETPTLILQPIEDPEIIEEIKIDTKDLPKEAPAPAAAAAEAATEIQAPKGVSKPAIPEPAWDTGPEPGAVAADALIPANK